MTRDEQLSKRELIPGGVINILAIWEAMDGHSSLQNLREDVGSWELRDLAITLYPYVEAVWDALDDDRLSYDWEVVPRLLTWIDWTTAQGSPITVELPSVEDMVEKLR